MSSIMNLAVLEDKALEVLGVSSRTHVSCSECKVDVTVPRTGGIECICPSLGGMYLCPQLVAGSPWDPSLSAVTVPRPEAIQ